MGVCEGLGDECGGLGEVSSELCEGVVLEGQLEVVRGRDVSGKSDVAGHG